MAWRINIALGALFQLLVVQGDTACSNVTYGTEYNKWYWQPFNQKGYMLSNVKRSWGDAATWCATQNATLASIHDARENSVVQCLRGPNLSKKDKWVGGVMNFTGKTSAFSLAWQDNTTFDYGFTTTSGGPAPPWINNGPYTEKGTDRTCILFDGRGLGWKNGNCKKPKQFICQKDPNGRRRETIPVRRSLNDDDNFIVWSYANWTEAENEIALRKSEWQAVLTTLPSYPENRFQGRGIVMIAGGSYLTSAMVVVKLLRQYGCTLRIQFWHVGPEEMVLANRSFMTAYDVETRDLTEYVDRNTLHPIPSNVGLRLFQLKPLALLHTDLEEILLIDSDNCPIRDPAYLFDSPEYITTGAVFWPDFWKTPLENPIWKVIGKEPTSSWEQESGQLLLNKKQAWAPLHLCVHMNSAFYMKLVNGDKDTFRFAWLASNSPFFMVSTWPTSVGNLKERFSHETGFCGHTMLQHDLQGAPLFVHHNQLKTIHFPAGENFKYQRTHGNLTAYKAVPVAALELDRGITVSCFDIHGAQGEDSNAIVEDAALQEFERQYLDTLYSMSVSKPTSD